MLVFPFQQMDAYLAARELACGVHQLALRDAELRDQATRAAKSCFLNLSEGLQDDRKPMRRRFFATARNSLGEAVAALDLAVAIGDADAVRVKALFATAARLRAMLTALLR